MFPVTEGLIGATVKKKKIMRTRHYKSLQALYKDLKLDMKDAPDDRKHTDVARSYLAVPFIGPQKSIVLILYADCNQLNFFADDEKVSCIQRMCQGFCRLYDALEEKQGTFPNLRNFPLSEGEPMTGARTAYRRIQEVINLPLPTFKKMASFNYQTSAG